jgi:hypothetical protein
MEQPKDEKLWKIAQKRAHFRRSAYSYVIVNTFLWIIWWFTKGQYGDWGKFPWPAWVMLGWGLGLAKEYYEAYHSTKSDLAEREYEKLKREGK